MIDTLRSRISSINGVKTIIILWKIIYFSNHLYSYLDTLLRSRVKITGQVRIELDRENGRNFAGSKKDKHGIGNEKYEV